MEYVTCNRQTVEDLKRDIVTRLKFLNSYMWIIDAYVSDFFTHNHWRRVPELWTSYLQDVEPPDLAFLLDNRPPQTREIPPLSLLAFCKCTDTLSLNRQKVDLYNSDVTRKLFATGSEEDRRRTPHLTSTDTAASSSAHHTSTSSAKEDIKDGQYLPLDACFRKHVKPKKQHEIVQLSRIIQLVGDQCSCGNVVDIGAGQGHLSRLLALGHRFKVTTVEAAGCHAPKAKLFDKDAQHDISRAGLKRKLPNKECSITTSSSHHMDVEESRPLTLPEHVTCIIKPDTSAEEFLKIVHTSFDKEDVQSYGNVGDDLLFKEKSRQYEAQNSEKSSRSQNSSVSESREIYQNKYEEYKSSKEDQCYKQEQCTKNERSINCGQLSFNMENSASNLPPCSINKDDSSSSSYCSSIPPTEVQKSRSHRFIMTGLHACGDLTTTMLRVFAGSPDIVGLASVACCYMKLTCQQGSEDCKESVGYPMSDFVRGLADSQLSYEAREMACHFCDSYRERLISNPPNLKLHCYRAMLQCVIRRKDPNYRHGCIKLNVKHADRLTFELYAKMGLKRLGLDEDIPTDLLQEVESYLPLWKTVISFYTIRLSLAPVVETVILLDRMLFLYEQGVYSSLVPIFDPLLSPRNFALVAVKSQQTN